MTTRRSLLAGLALPAALTACHPAIPVAHPRFAADHPDATLLDLERQHAEARAAATAAGDRFDAISEAIGYPDPPATLFLRDGDDALRLAGYALRQDDGRRRYWVEDANAERRRLRRRQWRYEERPVQPEDNLPPEVRTIARRIPWPEAQARADEIVAAWDGWQAAMSRIAKEAGLTAAEEELDRLDDARAALREAIWDANARTLDGLAVKARLAQQEYGSADRPNRLMAGLVQDIIAQAGGVA